MILLAKCDTMAEDVRNMWSDLRHKSGLEVKEGYSYLIKLTLSEEKNP